MIKPNYRDFEPRETSRLCENIEWSITYSYNARDEESPRALLIGDSICNQCQPEVRETMAKTANITYWISSKCVTDKLYFRELDFVLDQNRYDAIHFNNGLHSLTTDFAEWCAAYRAAVSFLMARCPKAVLTLVYSTPMQNEEKNAVVKRQNAFISELAGELSLATLDLFAPAEKMRADVPWNDGVHFKKEAVTILAEWVCNRLYEVFPRGRGSLTQEGSALGPDGSIC